MGTCIILATVTSISSPYATGPLSCLTCQFYLSVTLVCCGQHVAYGMEVGLGPCDTVLDGDPAPPRKAAHIPHFSAHVCCGQTVAYLSNC